MARVEIDQNEPLQPGDIVELEFIGFSMLWLQAAQIAAIEYWINLTRKEFTILNWSIPEKNKVIFRVRVNSTNPVLITALVIAGAITAVGVVAWLSLDKVYKITTEITQSPAASVAIGGIGSLAIVAAIILFLGLFEKK